MGVHEMMVDFDKAKKVIDSVETEAQLETAQKYYEAFRKKWPLPTKYYTQSLAYSMQNSLQSMLIDKEHKILYGNEQNN